MVCPRCGFEARDAPECARCGVVFAKLARPRDAVTTSRPSHTAPPRAASGPHKALSRSLGWRATTCSVMATMLRAGLPVTEVLSTLAAQATNARERAALEAWRAALLEGATFVDALMRCGLGAALGEPALSLLRAGERTGRLDQALESIAADARERLALQREVTLALVYPGALLVLGCLILPLRVLLLEGAWPYLRAATAPLLLAALALTTGWALMRLGRRRWPNLARWLERAQPRAFERLARARAAATLAEMLDAGLPVQEALTRAADACGRVLLREALTAVANAVQGGATLAEAFERAGIDAGLRTVVATGERSGTLPQSLSAYAQLERDAGLHNLRMTARLSTTVFALGAFAYLGWRAFAQVNEVRETFDRLLDVDPRQLVPGLEEGLRELRQAVE